MLQKLLVRGGGGVNSLLNSSLNTANNFYLLPTLKEQKSYLGFESSKSIFIVSKEEGISRISFFTLDFKDFKELLEKSRQRLDSQILLDIVSKSQNSYKEALNNIGFKAIATQQRLASNNANFCFEAQSGAFEFDTLDSKNLKAHIAKPKDAKQIYTKLRSVFDKRTGHLSNFDELKESIKNEQFFIAKNHSGEITTLLQAIISAKSFYINQIFNFGAKSLIHGILKGAIAKYVANGGEYIYAWVDENNVASQIFHAKYGLKHDGLYSVVYQYGGGGG